LVSLMLYSYYLLLGIGRAQLKVRRKGKSRESKIVGFKEEVSISARESILEDYGIKVKKYLPIANACLCEVQTSKASFQSLASHPEIEFIEDDYTAKIQIMPVISQSCKILAQEIPWGIERVGAPEVWNQVKGEGIKVGIIDTGVDVNHPDLKDNIKETASTFRDRKPYDDNGHGTHVAGTIAALDNDIGVVGLAPQAQIYSVKAFDAKGRGQVSNIIDGLSWCVRQKVHIINMSFGIDLRSRALQRAIRRVREHNIVMVAAAGNAGGDDTVSYPAKYPEVIAVAAADYKNQAAEFSSGGSEVDIMAPGVDITSTFPDQTYRKLSGTSMVCPHVTGAIALLASYRGIKADNIISMILGSAKDLGLPKEKQGAGLLDIKKAVFFNKDKEGSFSEQI